MTVVEVEVVVGVDRPRLGLGLVAKERDDRRARFAGWRRLA